MTNTASSSNSIADPSHGLSEAMANAQLSGASSSSPLALPKPLPTSLPTTLSRSYKLSGIPMDAYIQIFGDRIVLGVSQRQQRIGTWCLCQATQSAVDPKAIEFDINTVLGDRHDAMVGVYARQITERVLRERLIGGGSTTMVVLLGVGLEQPKDPEMFAAVIQILVDLIKDAILQMQSRR